MDGRGVRGNIQIKAQVYSAVMTYFKTLALDVVLFLAQEKVTATAFGSLQRIQSNLLI